MTSNAPLPSQFVDEDGDVVFERTDLESPDDLEVGQWYRVEVDWPMRGNPTVDIWETEPPFDE